MSEPEPTTAAGADAPAPEDGAAGPPRLSLAKRIVMMTVMAVFFLGLLEGVAQLYQKVYRGADVNFLAVGHRLYRPHPLMSYTLAPGVEAHGPGTDIIINDLGFRGPPIAVPKPEGVFRIVCLGGSTTFGSAIGRDADTYPRKLEKLLRKRYPDRQIEVVNAGTQAFTTLHTLANLRWRVMPLEPDLVTVYHATNDVRWAPRIAERDDPSRLERVKKRHRGIDELLEQSMLYMTITTRSEQAAMARPITDEERKGLFDSIPGTERSKRLYRRNLEAMVDVCRREGIPILLATFADAFPENPTPEHEAAVLRWTFGYKLTYEGLRRAHAEYNDIVRDIARAEGTLLAPCAEEITGRVELFADPWCHFKPAGTDEMARVFFETIEASGVVEKR